MKPGETTVPCIGSVAMVYQHFQSTTCILNLDSLPWTSCISHIPRIKHIPRNSPTIRNSRSPVPRIVLSPITKGIQNRPAGGIKGARHHSISIPISLNLAINHSQNLPSLANHLVPCLAHIIAIIVFQIINSPTRKRIRIHSLIPKATCVASTCILPSIRVHAKA